MSKIIEYGKVLKNHWKKSTFFFGVVAYGSSYFVDRYKTFQMMRAYCEEAKIYGEKPLGQAEKPKHVTVILNPEANNRKANVQFEKFVAPLLHLAGFKVSIFQTEFEKQAGKLMEIMSNTDAVIVAGGNGTVHEVVTGLLNRTGTEEELFPLGIIPLGKTNTVANQLFGSKSSSRAQLMAEAAMAVIKNITVSLDVIKVQFSDEEKPVFALCSFEQGGFADIEPFVEKYWYFGALKDKFTYFYKSFKNRYLIENDIVNYVAPCEGCSKCFNQKQKERKQNQRWWHVFIPKTNEKKATMDQKDWSKILNEKCGELLPLKTSYLNLSVLTKTVDIESKISPGTMWIKIFPDYLSIGKFISSGLSHRKSKLKAVSPVAEVLEARELILETSDNDYDQYSYIDNEKYPTKSCKISILPKLVNVYG